MWKIMIWQRLFRSAAVTGTATSVEWVLAYKAHGHHTIRRAMITSGSTLTVFPRSNQGEGSIRYTSKEKSIPGTSARSPYSHFLLECDAGRWHPTHKGVHPPERCGKIRKAGSLPPRDHGTRMV